MNDPEISHNLRRIVPDDLSTTGLVDGARRKRRRRQSMVGAAAALVLVAVAVPLTLNLPNEGPIAQPAATSTTPVPTTSVRTTDDPDGSWPLPGPEACYNEDGTAVNWSHDDGEAGPAEPGAVRAWFCGDYSPETGEGFVGPIEPLTSGLDAIIEGVQAADPIDLSVTTCTAEYNLSFNAVFEYADGSRRIIGGERHGCRVTYDGGVTRVGGEEFYGALYDAWERQRATDGGDWVVPHVCPGPLSLFEMQPWDAVQASVCGENADGSWSGTYLSDELVAKVADSMAEARNSTTEDTPQPDSSAPEQRIWLTLSNKFTDYQSLVRLEDGIYRAYDGEGFDWFWAPSEALATELDEAFANADTSNVPPAGQRLEATDPVDPSVTADPGITPGDAPRPFVSQGCENASSGELVSTDLPEGELPEGAERIWLCANDVSGFGAPAPPLEPLEDAGLVSQAAAAFNDLAPMPEDIACTMELGPSYLVVHEYADGVRYAVEIQDYGCRPAIAGDVVKENSELYEETLLELWGMQRADRGTTQTRPGPLCPLADSMFDIHAKDQTFASGVACVGIGYLDYAFARDEVPLDEDILALAAGQFADAPTVPMEFAPDGQTIVLLTPEGDPFVLERLEDGSFYWPDGEYARVWTPSGKAADAMAALFE